MQSSKLAKRNWFQLNKTHSSKSNQFVKVVDVDVYENSIESWQNLFHHRRIVLWKRNTFKQFIALLIILDINQWVKMGKGTCLHTHTETPQSQEDHYKSHYQLATSTSQMFLNTIQTLTQIHNNCHHNCNLYSPSSREIPEALLTRNDVSRLHRMASQQLENRGKERPGSWCMHTLCILTF